MPVTCIVVNCGSRGDRDNVSFYRIPNILSLPNKPHKNELSKTRRALWIASIKRDDLTESKLKYQRDCSKHFITGEPALLENKDHPDWVHFVCQPTSILLTFLSRGLDCLIGHVYDS